MPTKSMRFNESCSASIAVSGEASCSDHGGTWSFRILGVKIEDGYSEAVHVSAIPRQVFPATNRTSKTSISIDVWKISEYLRYLGQYLRISSHVWVFP